MTGVARGIRARRRKLFVARICGHGCRLPEVFDRAPGLARRERHPAERRQRVRLDLTHADAPADRQALFEDRPRLVVASELREAGAEAVQDDRLIGQPALAADHRERRLVVVQRRVELSALPLENSENVANRRFARPVADRQRERERRLERRNRLRVATRPQRSRDTLACIELASRIAAPAVKRQDDGPRFGRPVR